MPIVNVTDISQDFVADAIARVEKDIKTISTSHSGMKNGYSKLIKELNRLTDENCALKSALDAQMKYQKELRTDRDRLDWLEEQYRREQKSYSNVETEESALTNEVRLLFYTEDKKIVSFAAPSFRAALDAARKEQQ